MRVVVHFFLLQKIFQPHSSGSFCDQYRSRSAYEAKYDIWSISKCWLLNALLWGELCLGVSLGPETWFNALENNRNEGLVPDAEDDGTEAAILALDLKVLRDPV